MRSLIIPLKQFYLSLQTLGLVTNLFQARKKAKTLAVLKPCQVLLKRLRAIA